MKRTAPLALLLLGILFATVTLVACGPSSGSSSSSASSSSEAQSQSSSAMDQASATKVYDMQFHRGGRDARPENTLYSYQYAIENGATTIECDMQLTKDGQIVMSHNPTLNPEVTLDAQGNRVEKDKYYINQLSLDELRAYNVGRMDESTEYYNLHGKTQVQTDAKIPTLRELFELVRDSGDTNVRLNIETKSYPDPALGEKYANNSNMDTMVNEFYSLVKEFGFQDRVTLQSFDWSTLAKMEQIDPSIETSALYSEEPSWGIDGTTLWIGRKEASPWLGGVNINDFNNDPVKAAHSLGIDVVSPYYTEVVAETIKEAHEFGMKVIPWSVNEREDMEKLYNMGVDGIITDRPWVLREFLESKGETIYPKKTVDLPYHLDPDHLDVETTKAEGGSDASH